MATGHATLSPATRAFVWYLPQPLTAGEYLVRVRAEGTAVAGAEATEQVRITVPAQDAPNIFGQPLLFRRGPFTGPGFQPTADLRFRRAERVRVDVPLHAGAGTVSARVLDRKGQALPVPPVVAQREDSGVRFAIAEVTLAPLAPGDYLIEVSTRQGDRQEKVLTAIRIVP